MTNNFKLPKNVTHKELEEKSDMFASIFSSQWLQITELGNFEKNQIVFPPTSNTRILFSKLIINRKIERGREEIMNIQVMHNYRYNQDTNKVSCIRNYAFFLLDRKDHSNWQHWKRLWKLMQSFFPSVFIVKESVGSATTFYEFREIISSVNFRPGQQQ